MRKICALLLCFSILLFATGCGGENAKPAHDVDIAYFADMGTFPESELKLGDSVPEETENDETYYFYDNADKSYFSTGEFNYYYDASQKEPKISAIVGFNTCYGFENGSVSIEITAALDSQGIKYKERIPAENELFFLPAAERSVIECESLKHNLIFVLEDNALCATLID